jgi:hypothetical protein
VELLYTSLFLGSNQFVYVGSWMIILAILILGAAQACAPAHTATMLSPTQ